MLAKAAVRKRPILLRIAKPAIRVQIPHEERCRGGHALWLAGTRGKESSGILVAVFFGGALPKVRIDHASAAGGKSPHHHQSAAAIAGGVMATYFKATMQPFQIGDLDELRKNWGWFVALGVILIILGAIAVGAAVTATLVSMVFLGWLMVIGGILQAGHAFWREKWSGLFLDLFIGILYIATGAMVLANPAATALALTLLISLFLLIGGIFRIGVSFAVPFHHRGWILFNGVIAVLLGILIWTQWPLSGLWAIGLFVGIDLILNGWALVMLGLVVARAPQETTRAA
jgi:uncharacterized membrane protein HdeD (DUF308 family)